MMKRNVASVVMATVLWSGLTAYATAEGVVSSPNSETEKLDAVQSLPKDGATPKVPAGLTTPKKLIVVQTAPAVPANFSNTPLSADAFSTQSAAQAPAAAHVTVAAPVVAAAPAASAPAAAKKEVVKDEVAKDDDGIDQNDGMPPEGVTLAHLQQIVAGFKPPKFNDAGLLEFHGLIPEECAKDAKAESSYDSKKRVHVITLRLNPKCEKEDFRPKKPTHRVLMSAVFPAIKLGDKTGRVVLRAIKGGDITDKTDPENYTDDVLDVGKVISKADAIASERKARATREEDRIRRKRDDLLARVEKACKSGDYQTVSDLLTNDSDSGLIDNVETILSSLDKSQHDQVKKKITAAQTADEAKTIYNSAIELAGQKNWDDGDKFTKAYLDRRLALVATTADKGSDDSSEDDNGKVKKKGKSAAEVGLDEILSEIKDGELDAKIGDEYKRKIAVQYGNLATQANDDASYDESVRIWTKARKLVGNGDKTKIDEEIVNVYLRAFQACVKKDPSKMQACEKKYVDKAKNIDAKLAEKFAQRAAGGNEDAQSEYQDFMQRYATLFGSGPQYTVPGYGTASPQNPGLVDQVKQQGVQTMQQQYQQRMMNGGMAGGMGGMGRIGI